MVQIHLGSIDPMFGRIFLYAIFYSISMAQPSTVGMFGIVGWILYGIASIFTVLLSAYFFFRYLIWSSHHFFTGIKLVFLIGIIWMIVRWIDPRAQEVSPLKVISNTVHTIDSSATQFVKEDSDSTLRRTLYRFRFLIPGWSLFYPARTIAHTSERLHLIEAPLDNGVIKPKEQQHTEHQDQPSDLQTDSNSDYAVPSATPTYASFESQMDDISRAIDRTLLKD